MYAIINKACWSKISLKMTIYIAIVFICTIVCGYTIFITVMSGASKAGTAHPIAGTAQTRINIPDTLFENRKKTVIKETAQSTKGISKLPLFLKGILASTSSTRSLAILQGPSGQHSYREGEKLADVENAYLQSVKSDRVLIRTSQGIATLYLDEKSSDNKHQTRPKQEAGKEQVKYLMHYLVANPVYKDKVLLGYRFNPRAGSNIYLRTGLIPGEIVIKLNGQYLNNVTTADKYIEQLENLRDVQLTVLREGQLQNIYINLATIETSLDASSHEEIH
ncbi:MULTISPECIES: type II secretion system protein GspC [Enterobacterales]|uniref:type II secretion system protein GspC n=1 Tax=Enterobacterales TaxID=91347 RepID=UPI002EDAA4E4